MLMGLVGTGCQTYQQQNGVIAYWHQGNLPMAMAEAQKRADNNAGNRDAIVWRLEQGAVLRAAGKYDDSNTAFDQAQLKIDDYAQKAKVRVSQETGALLSNQAELDYEGRSYDGIMLNTYKALNYLALGQNDKARPELRRAYERQQDAVAANQARIDKVQQEQSKTKDQATIVKAESDPTFKGKADGLTPVMDDQKSYADYVNPFTIYLDGLYFLYAALDDSDLQRAQVSFRKVGELVPDNDYIKQDQTAADAAVNHAKLDPVTYVIFETGCAPTRDQIRIDVPIIVSKVSYVGAAFPTLRLQGNYIPSLTVTGTGVDVSTKFLASIDGMVVRDFKNELPVVIIKTVAATVTKAVAAYAINQAANSAGGPDLGFGTTVGGLISQIGTATYQMAVNIADERTWTTLPKEFQVARFATPADRKIDLTTPSGLRLSVTIMDGTANVVYVKSINTAVPLLVSQFRLK